MLYQSDWWVFQERWSQPSRAGTVCSGGGIPKAFGVVEGHLGPDRGQGDELAVLQGATRVRSLQIGGGEPESKEDIHPPAWGCSPA